MSDNHLNPLPVIEASKLAGLASDTGLGMTGIAALFAEQMAFQLVDLQAAIESGSVRALTAVAHRCVGSTAVGGMEQLTALLRRLEQYPEEGLAEPEACLAVVERAFGDVLTELAVLAEGSGMADVA